MQFIRLNVSRKVAKSGDSFDGRKIEIPSIGMLHSRVLCVPTDLEPRLSVSRVGLLKDSSRLVAPINTSKKHVILPAIAL